MRRKLTAAQRDAYRKLANAARRVQELDDQQPQSELPGSESEKGDLDSRPDCGRPFLAMRTLLSACEAIHRGDEDEARLQLQHLRGVGVDLRLGCDVESEDGHG